MTKLLIHLFIKNSDRPQDPAVRQRYGILSGAVGIVLNTLLALGKLIAGSLTNSIAITADALNNLSDAGSSVVNLIGFRISGAPADEEHPFGHGRVEYVSALILSFLVLIMGFELFTSSIGRIRNPEPINFGMVPIIILLVSIGGKIWLALFNRNLGGRIQSPAMRAVVTDCISDTAATSVTLVSLIISHFTTLSIDGYMGILVSLFILYSGVMIIKDTLSPLLGEAPDPKLVEDITQEILSYDNIIGVHDMMIHNYGPARTFGSAHAEVPARGDIMQIHDTIDNIERSIQDKFHIPFVLHMDPLLDDDTRTTQLRSDVVAIIQKLDPRLTLHDFRVVDGPTHTNLIFDLVIPHKFSQSREDIAALVRQEITAMDPKYFSVITVEHSFV